MQRDDGTTQLVAGIWPLYRFAGDAVPGEINGQGSGGVWFAADADGRLISAAESIASVTVETETGSVAVTTDGTDIGGSAGYGGNGS